jgi:hypothetical protein
MCSMFSISNISIKLVQVLTSVIVSAAAVVFAAVVVPLTLMYTAPPRWPALFELKLVLAIDCFNNGTAASLMTTTAPPLAEALLLVKLQEAMSSAPAVAIAPPCSVGEESKPKSPFVSLYEQDCATTDVVENDVRLMMQLFTCKIAVKQGAADAQLTASTSFNRAPR